MEENNALKNILKGAVIACDDDGMQDVGSYYEYSCRCQGAAMQNQCDMLVTVNGYTS